MPCHRRNECDHFIVEPYGILLADPLSSKGHWGLDTPDYMEQDNPDFLREGVAMFKVPILCFMLTQADSRGCRVVEAQDASLGYIETKLSDRIVHWK